MSKGDISLGADGSEVLLSPFGRQFSVQEIETARVTRTVSGALKKDIMYVKRSFTLAYSVITGMALEAIQDIYDNTAQPLTLLVDSVSAEGSVRDWYIRASAADNAWVSITFGNNLFVAVAYTGSGNRVMTSPDGITWTIRTSAADNEWVSATYGNGLFVVVSQSGTGDRVMTMDIGAIDEYTVFMKAVNRTRMIMQDDGLWTGVSVVLDEA